jgi:hypothetical protein
MEIRPLLVGRRQRVSGSIQGNEPYNRLNALLSLRIFLSFTALDRSWGSFCIHHRKSRTRDFAAVVPSAEVESRESAGFAWGIVRRTRGSSSIHGCFLNTLHSFVSLKSAKLKRGAFLQFKNFAKPTLDNGLEDQDAG